MELSLSFPLSLTHIFTSSSTPFLSLLLFLSYILTPSLSLFLYFSLSHSLPFFLCYSFFLSLSLSHQLSLPIFPSLTLVPLFSPSLSLSFSHPFSLFLPLFPSLSSLTHTLTPLSSPFLSVDVCDQVLKVFRMSSFLIPPLLYFTALILLSAFCFFLFNSPIDKMTNGTLIEIIISI